MIRKEIEVLDILQVPSGSGKLLYLLPIFIPNTYEFLCDSFAAKLPELIVHPDRMASGTVVNGVSNNKFSKVTDSSWHRAD